MSAAGEKYRFRADDVSQESFLERYEQHELLVVDNAVSFWGKGKGLVSAHQSFHSLEKLCDDFPEELQKTFTIEGKVLKKSEMKIRDFLKNARQSLSWYISVIMQESNDLLSKFFSNIPFEAPPLGLFHDECVWYFVGKAEDGSITGRAEHKDIISSSGSWHLQTNGRKLWHVRENKDDVPITLEVKAGDMIFINTSRWFHQTEIPKTPMGELSISYARDFWLHRKDFNSAFTKADKTNIETSWANADVAEGDVILCEQPAFVVQDAQNRAEYLACQQCFAPLGSANLHLSCLAGQVSRKSIIDEPTKPSLFDLPSCTVDDLSPDFSIVVDPSTKTVYCSQVCLEAARRSPSYHLQPSREQNCAVNPFFRFILKSGYFESFYLAAVAFLSDWIPSTRWETDDLNCWWEADPVDSSCVTMHCGCVMDIGFEMADELVVRSVNDSYQAQISVGDQLRFVSGQPVRTLEEFIKTKEQIDELRKTNSNNIIGISNFPCDWVGVEFSFKRKNPGAEAAPNDVAEVAENAWRLLLEVIREKNLDTGTCKSKERFFKLSRFFHGTARELGFNEGPDAYLRNRMHNVLSMSETAATVFEDFCATSLGIRAKRLEELCPRFVGQAYYEQISTIPNSHNPNCQLCWLSDGLECTVVATRSIKAGEDLALPYANTTEENIEELNVEEERSKEGNVFKKQRIVYDGETKKEEVKV